MQIAKLLELKRVGRLRDHQYVAAELACLHFAGDLGLDGAGAALEKLYGAVRENGVEGVLQGLDYILIHGCVDNDLAGDLVVDVDTLGVDAGLCRAAGCQAHKSESGQNDCQKSFHDLLLSSYNYLPEKGYCPMARLL